MSIATTWLVKTVSEPAPTTFDRGRPKFLPTGWCKDFACVFSATIICVRVKYGRRRMRDLYAVGMQTCDRALQQQVLSVVVLYLTERDPHSYK